jgi:hypothetical protein
MENIEYAIYIGSSSKNEDLLSKTIAI